MVAKIDHKECIFEPGECIVTVAARNGIEIPTLCHYEGLRGLGTCRVCVVEMNGKIVPACITKLEKPCEILTDSDRVREERSMMLALLRKRAPNSEVIAAMAERYHAPDLPRLTVAEDADRCILCGLCVQACKALGNSAIATVMRGTKKKIGTPYDDASNVCIGCGSCAQVCPTGSISVKDENGVRKIWHKEFRLVFCKRCGALLGTEEMLKKNRITDELCPDCRGYDTAERIHQALGK